MKATRVAPPPPEDRVVVEMSLEEARVLYYVAGMNRTVARAVDMLESPGVETVAAGLQHLFDTLDGLPLL